MATKQDVMGLFEKIESVFPRFRNEIEGREEPTAKGWQEILKDIPKENLLMAFNRYVEGGNKYPPVVGVLFQIAKSIKRNPSFGQKRELPVPLKNQCLALIGPFELDGVNSWTVEIESLERCVKYQGVYRRKMDFAIDVLGAAKVNELTQDWARTVGIFGGVAQAIAKGRFPKKKFHEFLDMLILFSRDVPADTKIPNYKKIFSMLTDTHTEAEYHETQLPF